MERTAGQGIEALRARFNSSLSMHDDENNRTSLTSRSRCDVLTTLRPGGVVDAAACQLFDAASFRGYLAAQKKTKRTTKDIVNYARRFGLVLESGDASVLLTLSPRPRHHAMTALANLGKFTGRYDRWLEIRRRYNLRWSKGYDAMAAFERFFNPMMSVEAMIGRVKGMMRVLPADMAAVIRFACLVGLRATEVCESVRLINDREALTSYYRPERQTLEHFRFSDVFIRQTKKAYISFVTKEQLSEIALLGRKTPSLFVDKLRRPEFSDCFCPGALTKLITYLSLLITTYTLTNLLSYLSNLLLTTSNNPRLELSLFKIERREGAQATDQSEPQASHDSR